MGSKATTVILMAILALALLPQAGASFSDVRVWHGYATSFTDSNGVVSATSFSLHSAPHGFTVTSRISLITVSVAFTTTPSSPATVDDYVSTLIIKEGSTTRATCDGISFSRANVPDTGRLQFSFLSFCHAQGADALNPGTTYTYETTVTMVSGTNHIVNSGWSISIEESDTITDATQDAARSDVAHILSNTVQMGSRLNTTCQKTTDGDCEGIKTYLSGRLNSTYSAFLVALVYRSGQTNSYINSTFGGIVSNSTFNITAESEPLLVFPEFSEAESWALLFFFIIMAIALWHEGWFLAGSAFLALLGIVLGGTILPWTGGLLLVCIGIWLESFLQRKRERERAPADSAG